MLHFPIITTLLGLGALIGIYAGTRLVRLVQERRYGYRAYELMANSEFAERQSAKAKISQINKIVRRQRKDGFDRADGAYRFRLGPGVPLTEIRAHQIVNQYLLDKGWIRLTKPGAQDRLRGTAEFHMNLGWDLSSK